MIRIAQVVEAVEGGCKRHVLDLLAGLDPQRFRQTALLSPHRDPDVGAEIARRGATEVELVPWDVRREVRPLADWAALRWLRRCLRQGDFDVVHCHSAKAGFLGRLAARGLRAKVLYTPHCLPFLMDDSGPVRAAYLALERWAGRFTDRLIAVAPSEALIAQEMRLVPPDRVVTIENGIDPKAARAPVDAPRKRAELGIGEGRRVVLSVGALRRQKGYDTLLEAAAATAGTCPELVFLVAGEGKLRAELEGRLARLGLQGRVRLPGSRGDVPELLAIADLFVMPSLWEGGPYALLEAMAAGVPVVGTAIPGVQDWVRDGETGYSVPAGDATALARAIALAVGDPAEARRRAAAARELVLSRNTRERWLREMTELYEEVAGATV